MQTVLTKEQMSRLDSHMSSVLKIPSLLLMENAAFGLLSAIFNRFGDSAKIVALCGPGNNGGDGFAAARQLEAKGLSVSVLLAGRADALKGDAAINAQYFHGRITEIKDELTARNHLSNLSGCVVIDALFGVGLKREISGLYADIIELLNNSGAYIVACDIASGIDADTGRARGASVVADQTVTFQCPKPGHFLYPGREHTGVLSVKEIGTHYGFDMGGMFALTEAPALPRRPADAHKGSFGKLACIVGSQGFSGAGLLCTEAALRAGAGLVTAGIPAGLQSIFSARLPESMTFALDDASGSLSVNCIGALDKLLENKTALAAGPGLSQSAGAEAAVHHMLTHHSIKKVFDADALNIIAKDISVLHDSVGDIVLTPHIVEFSRLCGNTPSYIHQNMPFIAQQFARSYNITLLLKGATTVVTDGKRTAFVSAGSPGMARGGSGDVLTGVIAGLICGGAEGGMDVFEAAVLGAYICGKAGEAAANKLGELSMTAADTLRHISTVTKSMVSK